MVELKRHPLRSFRYCPVCGSSRFEIQNEKSKYCTDCGFEYYLNPSSAVAAFILNKQGEILVTRRKLPPAKGSLDLPGGFCDIGETVEESVYREIKEETGLEITHMEYLFSRPNFYNFSNFKIPTLDAFFLCEVHDDTHMTAMDDVDECLWIAGKDIKPELFGLNSVREGVLKFLEITSKNLKK